jgi:hypothetical protein
MSDDWLSRAAAACTATSAVASRFATTQKSDRNVTDILTALDEFMECVRYLNTRRSKTAVLNLESEADVQDALYLMLRPWLPDLTYENPTDKVGNRFTIKDFLIPSAQVVLEAKYVRDQPHGKAIARELHDDIEVYRNHPKCDHLVFFIYDPNAFIPDVRALRADVVTERSYSGRKLDTYLIVKPD